MNPLILMRLSRERSCSGEPYMVKQCRSCGLNNAIGTSFVQDGGQVIFVCDGCGKRHHMGYTEMDKTMQIQDRVGKERALSNRSRCLREQDEETKAIIRKQYPQLENSPLLYSFYNADW